MGDDAQPLERHDPTEPLDLDLRVDDEPVRRPSEPAQAPDVGVEPALPESVAAEDVVEGDDERAPIGAPEPQQPREGPPPGAPPAPIPLQQDDLRPVELSSDLGDPLGLLVHAAGVRLEDGQPFVGRGLIGDQLAVSPDPALGSSEVQEPDAVEPTRKAQSVYPSWRSRSPASAWMSASSVG